MGQEDRFKKQLDELARALAKMLSDLLRAEGPADTDRSVENTSAAFKAELHLDPDRLMDMPDEAFLPLLESRKFSVHHMELLADVLYQLAEKDHREKAKLYAKIKVLLQWLNEHTNTWSMERQMRLEKIDKFLNQQS